MKGCSVPLTSLWLLGLHRPILPQTNEGLGKWEMLQSLLGLGFNGVKMHLRNVISLQQVQLEKFRSLAQY